MMTNEPINITLEIDGATVRVTSDTDRGARRAQLYGRSVESTYDADVTFTDDGFAATFDNVTDVDDAYERLRAIFSKSPRYDLHYR